MSPSTYGSRPLETRSYAKRNPRALQMHTLFGDLPRSRTEEDLRSMLTIFCAETEALLTWTTQLMDYTLADFNLAVCFQNRQSAKLNSPPIFPAMRYVIGDIGRDKFGDPVKVLYLRNKQQGRLSSSCKDFSHSLSGLVGPFPQASITLPCFHIDGFTFRGCYYRLPVVCKQLQPLFSTSIYSRPRGSRANLSNHSRSINFVDSVPFVDHV